MRIGDALTHKVVHKSQQLFMKKKKTKEIMKIKVIEFNSFGPKK